ncbi:hypothetical protein [Xinzhou nematode virus 6]|uniref:Uncharacterized protein n=1 Tax=Xinzhou nematode virus 6 TaxID=1923774 RepID=A0A1L3KIV9_9NIDO|nr:hypothetical protein [Xinzhou nematode virus 6]APG77348.1 hypothetical protein [Xinzhou nematode virus 6]
MASLLVLLCIVATTSATMQYVQTNKNYRFQGLNTSEAFQPFPVKSSNIQNATILPKIYCPIVLPTLIWTPEDFLCGSCLWSDHHGEPRIYFCDEFQHQLKSKAGNATAAFQNLTKTESGSNYLKISARNVPLTNCLRLTQQTCEVTKFRDPKTWNGTAFLLPYRGDGALWKMQNTEGYQWMFASWQNQTKANYTIEAPNAFFPFQLANYAINDNGHDYLITMRNYIIPLDNANSSLIDLGGTIDFKKASNCSSKSQTTCPTVKPKTITVTVPKECLKVEPQKDCKNITVEKVVEKEKECPSEEPKTVEVIKEIKVETKCNNTEQITPKEKEELQKQIRDLTDRSSALLAVIAVLFLLFIVMVANAIKSKEKSRPKPNNHPY